MSLQRIVLAAALFTMGAQDLPAGGTPAFPGSSASPVVQASQAAGRCGAERDVVVLLHGLGRTTGSMQPMARMLEARGYEVVVVDYPTRREPIERLALDVDAALEDCCLGRDRTVHFVTHSLGGIVLRYYLNARPLDNLGRVVMLAPPNGGSELVDVLRHLPVLGRHPGPARGALGTRAEDAPRRLGPATFDVGVIAGSRSYLPFTSPLLPGADDGVVAVSSARLDGMTDFLVVPRTHSFIMRGDEVLRQTALFLDRGSFDHAAAD